MQALYALEQGGGDAAEVLETVLKPALVEAEDVGRRFGERLFLLALDYADEADVFIRQQVTNWEVERIALVDHVVLRLAITEFLAFDDIPPKVTINEAIEIAKRYSTHRSGQFVNGVLDGVLIRLRESGRLAKSGRGLVGSTPGQNGAARRRTATPAPDAETPAPRPKRPRRANPSSGPSAGPSTGSRPRPGGDA